MFCIETVSDTIKINACDLGSRCLNVIHREIDAKYCNRILMDIGLCVARYTHDLTKMGNGKCDGSSTYWPVTFSLIVFRPFVGEIMTGKILKSTPEGITVSLEFFSEIYIPAYWMLNPSKFKDGLWIWTPSYDDDDDDQEEEAQNYEMNIGSEIRFRVKSIHYTAVTHTAKGRHSVTTSLQQQHQQGNSPEVPQRVPRKPSFSDLERKRSTSISEESGGQHPSAMHIIGSICEDGLGLTSWWKGDDDEEEENEGT